MNRSLADEPPLAAPLIALRNVQKRYGSIQALTGLSGDVRGRVVGLLGPNGAGKSTLLKCLLGLETFEGDASVLGVSTREAGDELRSRIGYMTENEAFLPGVSAVELCVYAGELSGLPRAEAMQRAHAALYYAGLEDKRYQPIEGYSTGMKQRVKLAAALVHDPELLFLDEPTNGLDPRARDEMLTLIEELPERRGCAIVVSTHLLPDVERVCDAAVIMDGGRIRFIGAIADLRRGRGTLGQFAVEVREDADALANALSAAGARCNVTSPAALEVDVPDGVGGQWIFWIAAGRGLQIRSLTPRRESLEAAFLRVVADAPAATP